jgi:thymidine phosphorylase
VTATVDCVPLITASIMSKKLAAGPETIVIDLKCGSGAFMTDLDHARELARSLLKVGQAYNRRMSVLFSDMSQPLGIAVGHAGETLEALLALRPDGREAAPKDLVRLTEELTAAMVLTAGLTADHQEALGRVRSAWDDGGAWRCLQAWVEAQGGRLAWDSEDLGLKIAPVADEFTAPHEGWIEIVDCRQIGLSLAEIGGARFRVEDSIDHAAGIDWLVSTGDRVDEKQPLARLRAAPGDRLDAAKARLSAAIRIAQEPVQPRALVLGSLP